jgi:ABC-type oligopeptide transport system ATPase subunit
MQRLVVESQFMGVKPCTIELNRFLLLIGEQASGKSTIAKLIYFFQTAPDAIYSNTRLAAARGENFDFNRHVNWILRDKFYETFGSTYHHSNNFDLTFTYENGETIQVKRSIQDKKAYVIFGRPLAQNLTTAITNFFRERNQNHRSLGREDEIISLESLFRSIKISFASNNSDFSYLIAGRNTAVGFPEIFESKIRYDLEKLVDDAVKRQNSESKRRIGNERLLLDFVEWAEKTRDFFKKNGGSFESAIQSLEQRPRLAILAALFTKILKGTYDNDFYGEIIRVNEEEKVFLKDASSGQQEVLRVLQGLFLAVGLQNRKEFFVVEEPEAHLYPLAQKELINAFAVFLNTIPQGKMIVTTHSPYVLACVNILLFANFVAGRVNGHRDQISVPQEYWLQSDAFSAYALSHNQDEAYCTNIKSPTTGLISQNYLDTISEQLGIQYHQLYDLLTLPQTQ